MINIVNKRDCTGCCACVDICAVKAIKLEVDIEGFWYPVVNKELCVDCGLCDKTCPELNVKEINEINTEEAICYGAHHVDSEIRLDSTSGGAFSALANKMYDEGGYVAGAVYNSDFSVSHIISNNREDLKRIRSSKYLQSNCLHLYSTIKDLLKRGEKVLVCGCPCQMAALRLYLDKEYSNLVIADFICLGINSPKIFRKYLDSLEYKYNSKVVYAKAKNKEFGWRNLTFKAQFQNGESYYANGQKDDFTRGFLQTGVYSRPSCYECNYKSIPRIADITLADFWGVERVNPALDNDTGTSIVMCNSDRGIEYFSSVMDSMKYSKVDLEDIKFGNRALTSSIKESSINREDFFTDVDKMPFNKVAKKYFPYKRFLLLLVKLKRYIKQLLIPFYIMGLHPKSWRQFFYLNFLRKNTNSNLLKGNVIIPTSHSVFDINKYAKININGRVIVGYNKVKGSKLETRIKFDKDSVITFNDQFTFFAGADVQVFNKSELEIDGGPGSGCNINCQIVCGNKITIGRGCLIGRNVVIRDYDAHYIIKKGYKISKPISIGDHSWIGDSAVLSKGVKIEEGAIVASRSWVVRKVKSKTLVAGSPAEVIDRNVEWKY